MTQEEARKLQLRAPVGGECGTRVRKQAQAEQQSCCEHCNELAVWKFMAG